MLNDTIPGTNITYSKDALKKIKEMIDVTGGLSLSQVCTITSLQTSTIQNWVKRGYIPHPENKKYFERHMARILLVASLKDAMNIEDVGELMILINGDVDDTSDDIISEQQLYSYFCDVIHLIDQSSLNDQDIMKTIKKVLSKENDIHKDRLMLALKTMVYGYYSGICMKKANTTLDELRR